MTLSQGTSPHTGTYRAWLNRLVRYDHSANDASGVHAFMARDRRVNVDFGAALLENTLPTLCSTMTASTAHHQWMHHTVQTR